MTIIAVIIGNIKREINDVSKVNYESEGTGDSGNTNNLIDTHTHADAGADAAT